MLPEAGQQIAVMFGDTPILATVAQVGADGELRDELYPSMLFFRVWIHDRDAGTKSEADFVAMIQHEGIFWTSDTSPEGLIALAAACALDTEHEPPSWRRRSNRR